MDLKATLNLPDKDFTIPMRAQLPQREPAIQARWKELDIYRSIQESRKDAPTYVLHDGPPYTNSPIHLGTALNKTLKDFVVKSRTLMGYRAPYVPGFDNHGLPIELAVSKKLGSKKNQIDVVEFRRLCREHAEHYIGVQVEQFQRLGVFGMWDRHYDSLAPRYEAEIVRVFKRLVEKGQVYRGLRPVLWSPTSGTALADTEILYEEHVSKSIYVAFPLRSDAKGALADYGDVLAVIWTTTPWTIPANLAVAFHPRFDYVIAEAGGKRYLLVKELAEKVLTKVGLGDFRVLGTVRGEQLEGVEFGHPIFDRASVGVLAEYVTTEDGTGVVHTAPGHGREDFMTGAKYGLDVLCPVDEKGILTDEAGEFAGVHYTKCDTVVVDRLKEVGALLLAEDYHHTYPHAERDGMPVIFRATEQWFVSIDGNDLRQKMLREIDEVQWVPRSGHARIRSMIEGRPDWCVSRQRPWGVGIPIFYGKDSGEPVLDPVAIEAVAELLDREGSDAWYTRDASEILPDGYSHPNTGETEFRKETDVLDVWFDSASTHLCVLEGNVEPRWKERLPADLYLEGSDQHRGWFNVSMVVGMAAREARPYETVLTHGFVVDGQGRKMSKRLGNVIDPNDACDQYGADVIRWWCASVNYTADDVPCSPELLERAGEGYRRVRNTLRFLLGNLYDHDPTANPPLTDLDRWLVERVDRLVDACLDAYERFDFVGVSTRVHNFCVNELSAFYLDAIKDRMYCDGKDWDTRRSAQVACHSTLLRLVKLLAPILPHTAEEVYERIPGIDRLASVHMETLERPDLSSNDDGLRARFETMFAVRTRTFGAFEAWKGAAGVKDSQDVVVHLPVSAEESQALKAIDDLPVLFKMADVLLEGEDSEVAFVRCEAPRCSRSRLRRLDVEEVEVDGETLMLTARDRKVLGL